MSDVVAFTRAAEEDFSRAAKTNDAQMVVASLEQLGCAVVGSPSSGVELSTRFVTMLAEHPGLVARAAALLGTYCEMYGEEALPRVLYARSGYQALLDADIWTSPPLAQSHLEESDAEIAALVSRVGLQPEENPHFIPSTHKWWPGA